MKSDLGPYDTHVRAWWFTTGPDENLRARLVALRAEPAPAPSAARERHPAPTASGQALPRRPLPRGADGADPLDGAATWMDRTSFHDFGGAR